MQKNRFLTSQSSADSLFAELRLREKPGYVTHIGQSGPALVETNHDTSKVNCGINAELGFASYEGALHVRRLLADPQFRHFLSVQCQKLDKDMSSLNGATIHSAQELQVRNARLQGRKEVIYALLKQPFTWRETNPDVGHTT